MDVAVYDSTDSDLILLNPCLHELQGVQSQRLDCSSALLDLLEVDHPHCVDSS